MPLGPGAIALFRLPAQRGSKPQVGRAATDVARFGLMLVSEVVFALSPHVTLLAGGVDLSAIVRWVHATDLPDPSPYLRGGELVLTNGQWRRTSADSRRFVRILRDAGVSAIGYGLQTAGTATPKDLVTACNRAGLPLIEIPHDMAFVEISELVATHQADNANVG